MRRRVSPLLVALLVVGLGGLAGCADTEDREPGRSVVSAPQAPASLGERHHHKKHKHRKKKTHSPAASTTASTLPASAVAAAGQVGRQVPAPGPVPTRTAKPLGVSYGDQLVWMSDADLTRALDDAVTLHATWIRMDISWRDLQYASASAGYRWALTDRVVDAAAARHLRVLAVLAYAPPWAKDAGCTAFGCPPSDPRAFATYAGLVAARYQGRVAAYEIWNEENTNGFWTSPDPARYAALLRTAAPVVKAADPAATVLLGGLASTKGEAGTIPQGAFLRAACGQGACDRIDAIAYHPYTYPYLASARTTFHTPWERMTAGTSYDTSLADVLASLDLGRLPLWITEFGAPTDGPGGLADGSVASLRIPTDHVTEALQAQILTDGARTAATDPMVAGFFAYTWRDSAHPTSNNDYYGLLHSDGTAKPACPALGDLFGRLLAS